MAQRLSGGSLPDEVARRVGANQSANRSDTPKEWTIGAGLEQLGQLRIGFDVGDVLHIVDRIPPMGRPGFSKRFRNRNGSAEQDAEPVDVVLGVRAAGFTIASIERFVVEVGGASQDWVDLKAIVLEA